MRNKIKFGRIALHSSVLLSLLASVACQTTRLPTAIKNSDNSAMTVQVSDDRKSLMWSSHASAGKNKETLAVAKLQGNDAAGLQLKAELALLGRMTQAASENARAVLRRDVRNVKAMKTLAKAALME